MDVNFFTVNAMSNGTRYSLLTENDCILSGLDWLDGYLLAPNIDRILSQPIESKEFSTFSFDRGDRVKSVELPTSVFTNPNWKDIASTLFSLESICCLSVNNNLGDESYLMASSLAWLLNGLRNLHLIAFENFSSCEFISLDEVVVNRIASLGVSNCKLTSGFIGQFASKNNLVSLTLQNSQPVDDNVAKLLHRFTKLKNLVVVDCMGVVTDLPTILRCNPNMKSVWVDRSGNTASDASACRIEFPEIEFCLEY